MIFSQEEANPKKKWWNFTERQEQRTRFPRMRRTVTTRGVVWRGSEKGRNTIHGGRQRERERDYDLHRWTVRFLRYPLSLNSRLHVQPPNVRLLVENRGTRGISRDCLRYLWRWRVLARHYPLSTNYSLRVNKTSKKGEREKEYFWTFREKKIRLETNCSLFQRYNLSSILDPFFEE